MKRQTHDHGWATPRSAGCLLLGALPATVLACLALSFIDGALWRLETDRSTLGAEGITIATPFLAGAGAIGLWIAVFTDPRARSRLNTWACFLIVAGLVADLWPLLGLVGFAMRTLPSAGEWPGLAIMSALFLGPFAFGMQYLLAQLSARKTLAGVFRYRERRS